LNTTQSKESVATEIRSGWRLELYPAARELGAQWADEMVARAVAAASTGSAFVVRRSRRATTLRVRLRHGPLVFLKLFDRERGLRALKERLRGARALHAATISAELGEAGFAVPKVLMVGRERRGGRSMLVSARVDGVPFAVLIAELHASDRVSEQHELLRALAAEVARLHFAGFVHGDLTPFNIFVVPGEPWRFIFMDHERTRRRFATSRAQMRNLVQLCGFWHPGMTSTDRLRLLLAYATIVERAGRRVPIRKILKKARGRAGIREQGLSAAPSRRSAAGL
jgi:hypothetical protein